MGRPGSDRPGKGAAEDEGIDPDEFDVQVATVVRPDAASIAATSPLEEETSPPDDDDNFDENANPTRQSTDVIAVLAAREMSVQRKRPVTRGFQERLDTNSPFDPSRDTVGGGHEPPPPPAALSGLTTPRRPTHQNLSLPREVTPAPVSADRPRPEPPRARPPTRLIVLLTGVFLALVAAGGLLLRHPVKDPPNPDAGGAYVP